jgi:D-glycerate 3-kinase
MSPGDIHEALADRIAAAAKRIAAGQPLIIGVCGPQGSGKSTLTTVLKGVLLGRGLRVAAVSLDDLYLPLAARERLARTVHPLFRTRGVPGTHDVELGLQVLAALRAPGKVLLPAFDKASDDRRPRAEWTPVDAPVEIIIFEGWCVGALPESQEALVQPVNALELNEDADGTWRGYVNQMLGDAYQSLFRQIDLLVLLAAPAFDVVSDWRAQQEDDLRRSIAAQGGNASQLMTRQQIQRFVRHYERLTRHILQEMPARADIVIRLDGERKVIDIAMR